MLFPTPWATASSGAVAVEPGYPFSWHGRCPLENLAPVAVSIPIFIVIWSSLLSNVKQSLAGNSETQFLIVERCIIYSSHSVLIIIILPISQLWTVKAIVFVNSPETQALNDSYQAMVLHRERGTEPLGDTLRFLFLIEADCTIIVKYNHNKEARVA